MRRTHTSCEVKDRYNRANYDQIILRLPKGQREDLQELAAAKGFSVNSYIQHLLIADGFQLIPTGGGALSFDQLIRSLEAINQQQLPPAPELD